MFDWDDLRIFLAVARARRIAPASRGLALDPTTIARRLARLEARLGGSLFETIGGERELTERGQALFAHAETIESAALAALGDVSGEAWRLSGHVRLSVAEGFATWVLAPALPAFRAANPEVRLDLVTASGFLNPSKREADMAVMLARPRAGRLIAAKLADYTLRLYAGARWWSDLPGDPGALARYPLVGYVPDFLYSPELDYLGEIAPGAEPGFRSTSINVQHRMVVEGAGLGVLPAFIGDGDARLRAVLPESIRIARSFWMVVHGDLHQAARIVAVRRWLREAAAGIG